MTFTTPQQRDNLARLAEYLERLPKDYSHFDMDFYCSVPTRASAFEMQITNYALNNGGVDKIDCGAVACAVGHGPAAGLLLHNSEILPYSNRPDWMEYADRAFGSDIYQWAFSGSWSNFDNTHRGAAARIRYYLANGLPAGFEDADGDDFGEYVDLYQEFLIDA